MVDDLWSRIERRFDEHAQRLGLDPADVASIGEPLSAALADFVVAVGPVAVSARGGLGVLAALLHAYGDEAEAEARAAVTT